MPKKKSKGKKKDHRKQTQYRQRISLEKRLWETKDYEERMKIRAEINGLR